MKFKSIFFKKEIEVGCGCGGRLRRDYARALITCSECEKTRTDMEIKLEFEDVFVEPILECLTLAQ